MRAVTVARRKGPDGKQLSAGFGFVECSSEAAAKAAVKALQGSSLDEHKLVLQLSQRKAGDGDGKRKAGGEGAAAPKGKKGAARLPDTTKVVVRNVAFEAARKDIMGLFTPFGQVGRGPLGCRMASAGWRAGRGGRCGLLRAWPAWLCCTALNHPHRSPLLRSPHRRSRAAACHGSLMAATGAPGPLPSVCSLLGCKRERCPSAGLRQAMREPLVARL